MTKKDFELIAAAVSRASAWQPTEHVTRAYALQHVADELADALATTNPKFDRARFLAACGVAS